MHISKQSFIMRYEEMAEFQMQKNESPRQEKEGEFMTLSTLITLALTGMQIPISSLSHIEYYAKCNYFFLFVR